MIKPTIIKKQNTKTTDWFGGKTTELYIYPENSEYKNLDFDFRLSTASITIESSDFTALPTVKRILILLEGSLELTHENHHSKVLKPYESDQFLGDWKTSSIGKAIDFNIMTRNTTVCDYEILKLNTDDSFIETSHTHFTCLFLYKGEATSSLGTISAGDIIICPKDCRCDVKTETKAVFIKVSVSL